MLVPLLIAVAGDVSGLAAHVARLGAVGAVAGDVAGLVAVVAGLVRAVAAALGAVPCDVPGLVTVVTRRLVRALRAFARYVSRAVTSVATVSLLLAVTREVSGAVALEALFALAVEARVTSALHASLGTLAGEVPRPVTLVAYARTHCRLDVKLLEHLNHY